MWCKKKSRTCYFRRQTNSFQLSFGLLLQQCFSGFCPMTSIEQTTLFTPMERSRLVVAALEEMAAHNTSPWTSSYYHHIYVTVHGHLLMPGHLISYDKKHRTRVHWTRCVSSISLYYQELYYLKLYLLISMVAPIWVILVVVLLVLSSNQLLWARSWVCHNSHHLASRTKIFCTHF